MLGSFFCSIDTYKYGYLSFEGRTCSRRRFPGEGLNRICSRRPTPQAQQRQTRAASATYTAVPGIAGSVTHLRRQGPHPRPPGHGSGVPPLSRDGNSGAAAAALLWRLQLEVLSEVWEGHASRPVPLPQVCPGSSGSFVVPYKLERHLFQSCENRPGQFGRERWKPVDCSGRHWPNLLPAAPRPVDTACPAQTRVLTQVPQVGKGLCHRLSPKPLPR